MILNKSIKSRSLVEHYVWQNFWNRNSTWHLHLYSYLFLISRFDTPVASLYFFLFTLFCSMSILLVFCTFQGVCLHRFDSPMLANPSNFKVQLALGMELCRFRVQHALPFGFSIINLLFFLCNSFLLIRYCNFFQSCKYRILK